MFNILYGINLVYGESATGKTTLVMQEALKEAKNNKKIAFIDTENSFSIERVKQMNKDYNELIKKIFVFHPKDFLEQHELIKKIGKFDLIVIDTIGNHYRLDIKNNLYKANARLNKQLRILKELNCKVLITNQVYFDINKNRQRNVGDNILVRHVDNIIKLEKNPRMLINGKKEIKFEINDSGLIFS
jgi:RecA/RadA recombinase